jgi:hypothetical protein
MAYEVAAIRILEDLANLRRRRISPIWGPLPEGVVRSQRDLGR